jgi:hypothetical protein
MSFDSILSGHYGFLIDTFHHLVLLHKLVAEIKVFEHLLDLIGELIAALCFQLGNHHLLSLAISALFEEQSPAEAACVKLLEHVLGLDIAEDLNHLVNQPTKLLVTVQRQLRILQVKVQVLRQELCRLVRIYIQRMLQSIFKSYFEVIQIFLVQKYAGN